MTSLGDGADPHQLAYTFRTRKAIGSKGIERDTVSERKRAGEFDLD
jgi:hypothetical protein